MDRRELFEKIADRLRDPASLARNMSESGFDKKDVNVVKFMVSASEEDFRAAAYSEDASASTKAVTKLSEETSIERATIASLIAEIRSTLGLVRPATHVSELMEVKNAGNNLMLGPGGFLFRPDPNRARSLFLYRYVGEDRDVEVPEAVQMGGLRYEVDSIGDSAFKGTKVESVALHDGIRTVGATAFRDCTELKSMTIPRTVLEVGVGAFRGCSALPSIEVEEGSRGYASVDGIVYDRDLKELLHAPGGLEGDVKIPEGTERIGAFAFYGCEKMTSVCLPDTLKAIGDSAFNGCSGLAALRIPASLDSIGGYAFSGCSGIKGFTVEGGNMTYSSMDGCLCSKDGRTLIKAPAGDLTEARIPASVEEVGTGAFGGCLKIEKARIGPGVRSVGQDAFKGCASLKDLEISEGVESIGKYAFFGCTSLEEVVVPDTVRSMGTWAFGDCSSLKKASVPSSMDLGPTSFPQVTEIVRRRGKNN
ncbi:MAG: leucine-rich repeat domain-containing protein [Candidatus Methanomethylophilaceae archaeon]|nr:leucine-rich repeat domain-containing protein [Candidatus Methanomethylophilaceae archaeon]